MFRINAADTDWLTLTTFNPIAYRTIVQAIDHVPINPSTKEHEKQWLQYNGTLRTDQYGTIFHGVGNQNGNEHFAIWGSGGIAGDLIPPATPWILRDYVRATRIDLQLTVRYNRRQHSQSEFADILRNMSGKVVSYVESASGPAGSILGTIYYGSRSSDRVIRIYEKMGMGEDVFLRFEVEFKHPRSMPVIKAICEGTEPGAILLSELDRLPKRGDGGATVYVDNLFHNALLDQDAHPIELIKPDPNTVKWLKRQVLPALERVMNDHDFDASGLALEIFRIIYDRLPGDPPDMGVDAAA